MDKKEFQDKISNLILFGGKDECLDDMIIYYIKLNKNNKNGVTWAEIENYFVHKNFLCHKDQICRRLKYLIKRKEIYFEIYKGLKFYKLPKKTEDDKI